jgi:hypothetical protein
LRWRTRQSLMPKDESDLAQWQVAIEGLMQCTSWGAAMLVRIAFVTALNRNILLEFNPGAKKPHWGWKFSCEVFRQV